MRIQKLLHLWRNWTYIQKLQQKECMPHYSSKIMLLDLMALRFHWALTTRPLKKC
ncbi:hypothetical protein pdam_00015779 [Pocillopora damicornis]|uniref:Uncharacterized protein n=1 Tax=Pocillopora damicornis TaxID=46731 RepID=A0A3M6USP1_POCDA|nr:hypothetical protein pdam_00015779 [Pocillopora damicornis]